MSRIDEVIKNKDEDFNLYAERLDRCSNDIKKLEEYLRSKDLNFDFFMLLPEKLSKDLGLEDSGLLWHRYGDKFRLIFNATNFPDTKQMRPLIERQSKIRLEVYPYLAEFVEAFAKEVKFRCGG